MVEAAEERQHLSCFLHLLVGRNDPSISLVRWGNSSYCHLHRLVTSSVWSHSWPMWPKCKLPLSQRSNSGGRRRIYTLTFLMCHHFHLLTATQGWLLSACFQGQEDAWKRKQLHLQSFFFLFNPGHSRVPQLGKEECRATFSVHVDPKTLYFLSWGKVCMSRSNWEIYWGMPKDGFIWGRIFA